MSLDPFARAWRRARSVLPLLATVLVACTDNMVSPSSTEQVVVVLNGWDRTLTVVPLGNANVRSIALGGGGTPTSLAVRGARAVVPMGTADVVEVVGLGTGSVEQTVALPAGSGATGVAFLNDSVALVANPGRNTVTPVNVLRGTAGPEVAVGGQPRAIAANGSQVFVANGTLDGAGQPSAPGTVTVLRQADLGLLGTVQLSGLGPVGAALRGGRLFVINSGTDGGNNSSLSVVDAAGLTEVRRVDQLGNLPRSLTTLPGQPVYVSSWNTGVLVYDPDTNTLVNGMSNPFVPVDRLPVSGVKLDESGLLYSLHPGDCTAPGLLVQITSGGSPQSQADVGVCPLAIGFGSL
jgi:hypothetical protein